MQIPKFLIADNSEFPDEMFILHTDFPRFLMNVESGEIEMFDALEEEPDVDLEKEIAELIELAYAFFDNEMESYES